MLLSSCAPDFSGHYGGNVTVNGRCDDASIVDNAFFATWVVADDQGNLSIATGGNCGVFKATARGDSADLQPRQCPELALSDGSTASERYSSGRMKLTVSGNDVEQLSATFSSELTVVGASGRKIGACTATLNATMVSVP